MYPEAGKCGQDFQVDYDEANHAWVVDLHDGRVYLKTFDEEEEVDTCLDADQCISLGLQFGQFRRNLDLYHHS